MKIRFECFGRVRSIVGNKVIILELENTTTVEEAIRMFAKKFGPELEGLLFNNGRFASFFSVQIDSKPLDSSKLSEITLNDGQTISLVPFVAGG